MESIVYLMGEAGTTYVKIGRTQHIAQRRLSLQSGNPRNIVILYIKGFHDDRLAEQYEKELHAAFAMYRVAGEWFNDSSKHISAYFDKDATKFSPPVPGRPLQVFVPKKGPYTGKNVEGKISIPPHTLAAFKALGGARRSAAKLQAELKCTRAVARYLAAYGHAA